MTICLAGRYNYYSFVTKDRPLNKAVHVFGINSHSCTAEQTSKSKILQQKRVWCISVKEKNFILCERIVTMNYNIILSVV